MLHKVPANQICMATGCSVLLSNQLHNTPYPSHAGSQCALTGVEVGDQVVAVNGKECFSLSSVEVRDLIYLGRVIKRQSLHSK